MIPTGASRRRATPMIFHDPLPFRHDYGCVGPIQAICKTSNDVRCRDMGSGETTREEVGFGGNEDVKMDEWSHQSGHN